MSFTGEGQLSCLPIPHFLDEKIVPVILPLPINQESTIWRPTGLFTASRARSYDPALMCVQIVDSNLKFFPHS